MTAHERAMVRPLLSRAAKGTARVLLPLAVRKRLAIWLGRQPWVADRYHLTLEMLRDLAERDPNGFHRFLWSHHLAYAETYEVGERLAVEALHPTRHIFLDELLAVLTSRGVAPDTVGSVLDVGSSLGYVLRHIERQVFTRAARLDGLDIDAYAIEQGSVFLSGTGSRVRLRVGDMASLETVLEGATYDVVLSAGTLMYLKESDAMNVVASMLRHTRVVLALAGLAHPDVDNGQLTTSAVRERDGTFIHNLDAMVAAAGGVVVRRRWDGARQLQGNTIYFVFAVPGTAG